MRKGAGMRDRFDVAVTWFMLVTGVLIVLAYPPPWWFVGVTLFGLGVFRRESVR